MKDSVLHVLMYLFHNQIQNNCALENPDSLVDHLESAGFILPAINRAIGWLADLTDTSLPEAMVAPQENSFRLYTPYEIELLGEACINFIVHLEKEKILTPITREVVINQTMELQAEGIDLSLMKWVCLMVLYNQPQHAAALAAMELLVLENPIGGIN